MVTMNERMEFFINIFVICVIEIIRKKHFEIKMRKISFLGVLAFLLVIIIWNIRTWSVEIKFGDQNN